MFCCLGNFLAWVLALRISDRAPCLMLNGQRWGPDHRVNINDQGGTKDERVTNTAYDDLLRLQRIQSGSSPLLSSLLPPFFV